MDKRQLSSKELASVLGKPVVHQPEQQTLTLIGLVRAGRNKETIEIALGNTGKWVALPLSLIESAEESGTIAAGEQIHRVMALIIKRPTEGTAFFDLLAFALEAGGLLMTRKECGCGGSSGGAPPGARAMGKRPPKTTVANCFACWIMTMGYGESFCYSAGHCDN